MTFQVAIIRRNPYLKDIKQTLSKKGVFLMLPINPEVLQKRNMIPELLSRLADDNPDEAIRLLKVWAEKKMPITPLYEEILSYLNKVEEKIG